MKTLWLGHGAKITFGSSAAVYFLLFPALFGLAGPAAVSLAIVPVVIAAWSFELPVVIALGAVVSAIALEQMDLATPDTQSFGTTIISTVAFTAVGAIVGYARSMHRSISRLMATDPATGLLNRATFVRTLEAALKAHDRSPVDVVAVDMIHFRGISETFGHEIGDHLLRAIGSRLQGNVDRAGRVARIGEDKFLIWMPSGRAPVECATLVLSTLATPFTVAGSDVRLEARVAAARYPDHASTAAELVVRAEIALDDAKSKGRAVAIATPRSEQERLSRLETFAGLRAAIENGQLRLHYQPLVDLPDQQVRGVEALVRWQHPERGLLAPSEFISVAEDSGLVVPLTAWVLDEALRQSRAWADEGQPIRISVNIGAKTLGRSVGLARMVADRLQRHGVAADMLVLEVTESDVMTDTEFSIACLTELKALGVRIELDDFGTGYSSLAYLQKLPLDAVKIDRSLVAPLFGDASTSSIVRAAIELSHALGLETVAEGVEDQAVVDMLVGMGCDAAQGYVFGRPMSADQLRGWLASRASGQNAAPEPLLLEAARAAGPGGTILVVDDEHPFRISAHRILTAQGYTVLHAATASEALRLCTTQHAKIDLVLTDVYLTDWQGHKLAAHLRSLYPALKVMFMSGDPSGSALAGQDSFLAKPFTRQELVSGVTLALAS